MPDGSDDIAEDVVETESGAGYRCLLLWLCTSGCPEEDEMGADADRFSCLN